MRSRSEYTNSHQIPSIIHPHSRPPARPDVQAEEKVQVLRRCEEELGNQLKATKREADDLRMHSEALEEEADDLRAKCVAATNEAATAKAQLAQALSRAADEVFLALATPLNPSVKLIFPLEKKNQNQNQNSDRANSSLPNWQRLLQGIAT